MKPAYDLLRLRHLRLDRGILHDRFGDLNRPDCVVMPDVASSNGGYQEKGFHFIHLSVTGRCNARCSGCINAMSFGAEDSSAIDNRGHFDMQPERDAEAILNLLKETNVKGDVVVCLYGGEPLLVTEKVDRPHRILANQNGAFNLNSFPISLNDAG